jgi:hypothetical protein
MLQSNVKYPLLVEPILIGVSSDEELVGKDANLKYVDDDITNAQKFLELESDRYLCNTIVQET